MNLSYGFHSDLSENAMFDLVNEVCAQTASLLEVLAQCGAITLKGMVVYGLEQWSVVEDLLGSVPGPITLVKQWVKVVCHLNENIGFDNGGPTLFSLLPSSLTEKNGEKTMAKILQQELLSYEQMETLHPDFCQIMQMKVIDILLKDVYANKDNCLQRSKVLIRKGWAIRATGVNRSRESVDTLSEAISIIEGEKCSNGSPICPQLGVAYCLHALSYPELEPNSKQVLQDIKVAVIKWLSVANRSCACDGYSFFSCSSLLLLYHIIENFEVLFKNMPCGPYHYEIPHHLDDLVDDVERAACGLISSVPATSH